MKFRDISERVKGGKLDPLSKMGKSKLTGQEIAKYYRDNPKAKQAARDKTVKKAIELALDLGGAQSYAIKEIEKLKRGLSKMPVVQQALRTANESVNEGVSVYDERIVNKGKGIIIMIDDNGKKVSAIFKDKKNAKEFNRNKPADIKKLLQLAKKTKYPKAIDESINEDITSAGYSFLRKAAYGIGIALRDLNSGIKRQNDKIVLNEIDYIYDKVIDMKRMLK